MRNLYCFITIVAFITASHSTDLIAQNPFWQPSNGPATAVVATLAKAPNGTIFAAGRVWLYRSTNSGMRWSVVASEFGTVGVMLLATTPRGTVIAIDGAHYVWRSEDNGDSWTRVHSVPGEFVSGYGSISVGDDGVLYIARDSLVMISLDDGRSWRTGASSVDQLVDILSVSPDTLLVISRTAVFLSSDSGATLTRPDTTTFEMLSAIERAPNGDVIALGYHAGKSTLHRSTDNGIHWMTEAPAFEYLYSLDGSDAGLYASSFRGDVARWNDANDRWDTLAGLGRPDVNGGSIIGTPNGALLAATNAGVFRLDSAARSWDESGYGMNDVYINALEVLANGDVYALTAATVSRSTNIGSTWTTLAYIMYASDIEQTPRGTLLVAARDAMHRSTDDGTTWTTSELSPDYAGARHIVVGVDGTVYASRLLPGLFRSTDDGVTWYSLSETMWIDALEMSPNGVLYAAAREAGVFRSTDRGMTWERTAIDVEYPWNPVLRPLSNGVVLFATGDGHIGYYDSITRATTEVPADGVFVQRANIVDLLLTPEGMIYAAAGFAGVWRGGLASRWEDVSDGLTKESVNQIAMHPSGYLFAGTSSHGVVRSSGLVSAVPVALVLPRVMNLW